MRTVRFCGRLATGVVLATAMTGLTCYIVPDLPNPPDPGGRICGGIIARPCDEGEYCHYDLGTCGSGDQSGICEPVPEVCPEFYSPVCGCDGVTYGNPCEAAAAGMSIASHGSCEQPRPGDDCHHPPRIGILCIALYDPVCGCDGHTYGNACEADVAGVRVVSHGPCEEPN